jgi:hypothetical protein
MDDATLAQIQTRLRRVERHNRVLTALLCAATGILLLGAASPAPNVVNAYEVRAYRFTLLDPAGNVADDWYTNNPNPPGSYAGYGYHAP